MAFIQGDGTFLNMQVYPVKKVAPRSESQDDCVICFESVFRYDTVTLCPRGHSSCRACAQKLLQFRICGDACPLCREAIFTPKYHNPCVFTGKTLRLPDRPLGDFIVVEEATKAKAKGSKKGQKQRKSKEVIMAARLQYGEDRLGFEGWLSRREKKQRSRRIPNGSGARIAVAAALAWTEPPAVVALEAAAGQADDMEALNPWVEHDWGASPDVLEAALNLEWVASQGASAQQPIEVEL